MSSIKKSFNSQVNAEGSNAFNPSDIRTQQSLERRKAAQRPSTQMRLCNVAIFGLLSAAAYKVATRLDGIDKPSSWQRACETAKSSTAAICASHAQAPVLPPSLSGFDKREAIAALCEQTARRSCSRTGDDEGIIVHDGVVYTESLWMAPPFAASHNKSRIDNALRKATHHNIEIVGEHHGSLASNLFRMHAFNRAVEAGNILLLEGYFSGSWYTNSPIDTSYDPGSNPPKRDFSISAFGGLEKPDTRFLALAFNAVPLPKELRFDAFLTDVRQLPHVPDTQPVLKVLKSMSTKARDAEGRVGSLLMHLAVAKDARTAKQIKAKAMALPMEVWDEFLYSFVSAMHASVAARTHVNFLSLVDRIPESRARMHAATQATMLWPRDQTFADSILETRKQYPSRNITAILGAQHAHHVRQIIDRTFEKKPRRIT